jgi:hypothetical protein
MGGDAPHVRKRRERPQSPGSGSKEIPFVAGGKVNIETDRQARLFTLQSLEFASENHISNARVCVVIEKVGVRPVDKILVRICIRRVETVNAARWYVGRGLETVDGGVRWYRHANVKNGDRNRDIKAIGYPKRPDRGKLMHFQVDSVLGRDNILLKNGSSGILVARSVSEYSEFAYFDHKLLWFWLKQTTTCNLKNDFSDTLIGSQVQTATVK